MVSEYVILRALHPTYLNLQLPTEVGELIQYDPEESARIPTAARGIAFLARGPGIARVVTALKGSQVLPIETVRNRYLASARLTEKLVFTLPEVVVEHLRLKVQTRPPRSLRFTDDGIIWFLPAPEYYEYRAVQRQGRRWNGPASGGLAHVYLASALLPFHEQLEVDDRRIDREEWAPQFEALARIAGPKRSAPGPG